MSSLELIITEHVAPIIGIVLAIFLDGSALPEFISIYRSNGSAEHINPLPYATLWATCLAWIIYSCTLQDLYLFLASLPGLILTVFYLYVSLSASSKQHTLKLALCVMFFSLVYATLGFISVHYAHDAEEIWGWTANATLVVFYASPLSDVLEICRMKDSSSIFWPLAVMETIYGGVWFIYGLALSDAHIWAPNSVGAVFGLIQIFLVLVFGKKTNTSLNSVYEDDD